MSHDDFHQATRKGSPLKVGKPFPSLELPNQHDRLVSLPALDVKQSLVLSERGVLW